MTDIRASRRRFLPLLGANTVRHGTTSHATCFYKCGNACDRPVPNRTDNPTFTSVVQSAVSRRNVLKAAGVSALVVVAGPALPAAASDRPRRGGPAGTDAPLTFQPVEPNQLDERDYSGRRRDPDVPAGEFGQDVEGAAAVLGRG